MKIAFGMRLIEGPWGGGMQFGKAFASYFGERGNQVLFDLRDPEIDIILLTDPRRSSASATFSDADIAYYLTNTNPRAIVVQRVNDNSRSRNSNFRSRRLALANHCAHQTVFISQWLQGDYEADGFSLIEPVVIQNGGDRSVFHPVGGRRWDGHEKVRVVTHHWSTNWNKGFDVYNEIDRLLDQQQYREAFEVTFVGRVPSTVRFRNTRVVEPLAGTDLADELRSHHVYISASIGEPAGMHIIEGALCGLPVLYRQSGALPEYCEKWGWSFAEGNVGLGLLNARERYSEVKLRMADYPYDIEQCFDSYDRLFRELLANQDEVLGRRKWTHFNGWIFRSCARVFDLVIYGYDRLTS